MKVFIALCLIGIAAAFPFNNGVKPNYGNPEEWGPYFEGDIKFKDGINPKHAKNGVINEFYRWADGVVIYAFDTAFQDTKKATVEQAMQSYVDLTGGCISFLERTTETDYVLFTGDDNDGCFSYIGKIGGQQQLNYPQWCIDQYGSVQHEMLHTLGFYHEQSSPDRDEYVTIEWANIQVAAINNFAKCDYDTCTTYGEIYDYGSVMHYSGYAFSANGELTIVTNDASQQSVIGQRVGLSDSDITKLMLMYNC